MDDGELVERAVVALPEIARSLYGCILHQPEAQGLSVPQIKAMGHLHRHGQQTVGELAAGLGVSMPAASELIDRLVEHGLVERGVNPADRRQVLVSLMPEAREFGTRVHALRRQQVRRAFARLDLAEREAFVRGLGFLAEALREDASLPPAAGAKVRPAAPAAVKR